MEPDMLGQTMPLFSARPHNRMKLSTAAARLQHPAITAVGTACRVPRSAASAGGAPSVNRFTGTYGLIRYHRGCVGGGPMSPGALETQEPLPHFRRACPKPAPSVRGTALSELMWEEQVARLEVRCREHEERIELALLKSSYQPSSFLVSEKAPRHSPLASKAIHRVSPVKSKLAARRCNALDALQAQPASFYVRDSELLRALQSAEARIRELERETRHPNYDIADGRESATRTHTQKDAIADVSSSSVSSKSKISGAHQAYHNSGTDTYTYLCPKLVIM